MLAAGKAAGAMAEVAERHYLDTVGIAPEQIERHQRVEKVTRSAAVQRELVNHRVKPKRAVAQRRKDPKRDRCKQDLRLPERARDG